MLIKSDFEVAQPLDKVWPFFDDIPQVAACLPGAELTEATSATTSTTARSPSGWGRSSCRSPARPEIKERDDAAKRIVVDAAGADEKGRGQAAMLVTAKLAATGRGHAGSTWRRTCSSPARPRSTAAA